MSPPRHAYGPNQPGRLPAAMVRALAAEISDPKRFSRAKGYARDGAVVDIVIEPGEVRGSVQGSRFEPYLAVLYVPAAAPGEGTLGLVPDRDDVLAACSCPDAETSHWCKHSLAVLLVLADEITLDPDVLSVWRASAGDARDAPAMPERHAGRATRTGRSGRLPATDAAPVPEAEPVDILAALLAAPAPVPELPTIVTRIPMAMAPGLGPFDADIAAAITSAISTLLAR